MPPFARHSGFILRQAACVLLLLALLTIPAHAQNVALGKAATASGATFPGYPASNINDGNYLGAAGMSHPADGSTLGFYYQVNLGSEIALNRIVLYNRSDCCADRLSNYRVTLYADSAGVPGAVRWQASIRTDGTNSGQGGNDTIYATASTNPAHQFKGRFIRVENLAGAAYNPQIAEVEAYPEPPPTIRYFLTDAGNISGPGLPASAMLSWGVENADAVSISGLGAVATTGSAAVTPASATTYTLTATRVATSAASTATVTVAVNSASLAPRITEFQAADGLLEDENGDRPDWIEIRNPNTFTLNLAGYALTDSALTPLKWLFPLANIAPGGYAVIFASGKNRAIVGAPLHTNFSLTASGEYLALTAPGGALVQQFPADFPTTALFPKQSDRVTYGLDGAGNLKYFKPPTPGAANGAGFDGVVADTTYSVKRGIYTTAQTVTLTTPTPGATLVYTRNGSDPTLTNGTQVPPPNAATAPTVTMTLHPGAVPAGATGINFAPTNGTTMLRAAAFKTGLVPTNVDTNTYVFPASVVTSTVMSTSITQHATYGPQMQAALTDLPSISIVTPQTIANGTSVLCSFEYLPVGGIGVQENAGVENYGGAYTNFLKKSFRVRFSADFGAAKLEVPELFTSHARGLKPVGKFDQLELRSGSHDMALRGFYMSNIFTDGTLLDMGELAPHSRFVHLYLNGTYWGMFHLRERWGADQQSAYLGGPAGDYESINGNLNVGGWAEPASPYDGDGTSWERVKTLRANYTGVRPYLDVRDYIDYMLLFLFGNSEDEWRSVGPKNIGSGFKFMLNDADGFLATQSYSATIAANRVALRSNPNPGRQNGDGPGSLFSQLWQQGNTDYKTLLADRIHKHLFNNGPLTVATNQARLNAMCAEMQRAFYAESARWISGGQSRTPDTWVTARDYILNTWFPSRTSAYLGYLQSAGYYPSLAAPAFGGGNVAGGTVLNFPVGATPVYFTRDGSDPRLPGGAVNPSAFLGTSTTITANTWLRARAKSGATWSALNEAFYTVTTPLAPGDIVFSEIHYNPTGDDDAEFIELWNPTTHAVNLRGAKFTVGLSYDFPDNRDVPLAPGGRLVLCASQYNFQVRYGIEIPVAGVYFDRLGNDGDALALATSAGVPLIAMQYDDNAPWSDAADGGGYSLVLANRTPGANYDSALNWRASTAAGGNPGADDTTVFPGGDLLSYALAANSLPALARQLDGSLLFTFLRTPAADAVEYVVETSDTLTTWFATEARLVSQVRQPDGSVLMTWLIPGTVQPTKFARLRVTLRQ